MSSFSLLLNVDESNSNTNQGKQLSKKALKKLKRMADQNVHNDSTSSTTSLENTEWRRLYENDGIWVYIVEYFTMSEIMMEFAVLSRKDLEMVHSYWFQQLFLLRGMKQQFDQLTSKDMNSFLCTYDQKGYFSKLKIYNKMAKRKKKCIEDCEETRLERMTTFTRLFQKMREENKSRNLQIHNHHQVIRSEIQAELHLKKSIWSSLNQTQFECFHPEFITEENLTNEEKQRLQHDLGEYYRFTCKKCRLVAISNYMPIFTGYKLISFRGTTRTGHQQFKLLNISKNREY